MNRYDEEMLIDDIKQVLISSDNCRIKIACIESYFNVYEKFLDKMANEVHHARV